MLPTESPVRDDVMPAATGGGVPVASPSPLGGVLGSGPGLLEQYRQHHEAVLRRYGLSGLTGGSGRSGAELSPLPPVSDVSPLAPDAPASPDPAAAAALASAAATAATLDRIYETYSIPHTMPADPIPHTIPADPAQYTMPAEPTIPADPTPYTMPVNSVPYIPTDTATTAVAEADAAISSKQMVNVAVARSMSPTHATPVVTVQPAAIFGTERREAVSPSRKQEGPGPGSYEPPAPATAPGAATTAPHHTQAARGSFGSSRRFAGPNDYADTDVRAGLPGPGHYNSPVSPFSPARLAKQQPQQPQLQYNSRQQRSHSIQAYRRSNSLGSAGSVGRRVVSPSLSSGRYSRVRSSGYGRVPARRQQPQPQQQQPPPPQQQQPRRPSRSRKPAAAPTAAAKRPSVKRSGGVGGGGGGGLSLAPTPGEKAWGEFCAKCGAEGLSEDELLMLSLDTLKALMKQVNLTDVVEAARVEVYWKQLRLTRPEYA